MKVGGSLRPKSPPDPPTIVAEDGDEEGKESANDDQGANDIKLTGEGTR